LDARFGIRYERNWRQPELGLQADSEIDGVRSGLNRHKRRWGRREVVDGQLLGINGLVLGM